MTLRRKRPCCICHRWFLPDNRVGSRQRACHQADCQAQHRRKQQSVWRARHRDYFAARRIQARMVAQPPAPLRLPPPLDKLPWEIAQSEFGVQGADFLGVMGGLLLHVKQSQLPPYRVDSTEDPSTLLVPAAQSQIPTAAYLGGDGSEGGGAAGISPT